MTKDEIRELMQKPDLSAEESLRIAETHWWKDDSWDPLELAYLQLHQDRLCMDFGDFHGLVEKALGRPVWTHEFADADHLRKELAGEIGNQLEEAGDELVHIFKSLNRVAPGKPTVVVSV